MKIDKSILILCFLLIIVLMFGTFGYSFIESNWTFLDSFYMTVITLTTIGFGEVRELSPSGRIFTIFLIIFGIGVVASIISKLGQTIIESGLNNVYGRKRMIKKISQISNHYIICGYGRIGRSIALKLHESDIDFVIIDSEPEIVDMIQAKGFPVLLGDSINDATLLAAGIERAAGTILCINNDGTNVNIALAARELNQGQNIIARGSDPSVEYRLIRAGADTVVYPLRLGGEQIAGLVADQSGKTIKNRENSSPSLLGYELKIYKNYEDGISISSLLHEKEALRPVAVRHNNGKMTHNIKPDFLVNAGESVLLLVNNEKNKDELIDQKNRIELLKWSNDLSVGIAQIDDEHRMLFKYAIDFQKAVINREPLENINKLFEHLIRYTETHFLQEEVLMKNNNYPELENHQNLHRRLTEKVMDLNKDKEFIYSDTIWHFLENWLTEHILVADKTFARFLIENKKQK